jgi:hypothetical protein
MNDRQKMDQRISAVFHVGVRVPVVPDKPRVWNDLVPEDAI